jgi:outer membrane protein assembly factor BamB/orotate phosphoribosyltransferase
MKKSILNQAIELGGDRKGWGYLLDYRKFFLNAPTEDTIQAADAVWELAKPFNPDVIFGKGIGSLPLLVLIKTRAWQKDGINLKTLFIRDQRKQHNGKKLIEGCTPNEVAGKTAVFVDDVFNKGNTLNQSLTALLEEDFELNIVGAVVLKDFWVWAGSRVRNAKGFPVKSVFRRHEFGLTRDERDLPKLLSVPKWRKHIFHLGEDIMPFKGLPTINENYLFVGNSDTNRYCFDVDTGDIIWRYDSTKPQPKGDCALAQVDGDLVYWTTYDGTVRCCNKHTGKLEWITKLDHALHSSPCIDSKNNRIFIATEYGKSSLHYGGYGVGDIVCINSKTGHEIWRFPTDGMIPCTAVYSPKNNLVYCGSNDFHLYCLDADTGALKFKCPTVGEVKGVPVLSENEDIVLFATIQANLYSVDAVTGELLWHNTYGTDSIFPFPCVYDTTVVVANKKNIISAWDIYTGERRWLCTTRSPVGYGVTDLGPFLLAVAENGQVLGIDKNTGEKITSDYINVNEKNLEKLVIVQPPAFDGKNLVIVTNYNGIFCYEIFPEKIL